MAFDVGALVAKLKLDTKGFQAGVKQATGQMGKMEVSALSLAKVLGTTLAVTALSAVVVGFKRAVDAAADFEKSMANVATLVDEATVDVDKLSDAVLDMTTVVNKSADDLSAGLYQVFSAGVTDAGEAMEVLEVAAIAATAGLATTAESVKAVTGVMNAFGLEASQATDISDLLFKTVQLGVTTYDELAGSIGRVLSSAASLDIKLEELFAAIATLTKGTFSTAEATTALRALFISILKPSDKAKETAKKLGLEWNATALTAKGLTKFINEMKEATEGNAQEMADLVPEATALNAALSLAGKQSEEFNKITEQMTDRIGASRDAFKQQEETYKEQEKKLGLLVDRIQIKIGNFFLPSLTKMLSNLTMFFEDVEKSFGKLKITLEEPIKIPSPTLGGTKLEAFFKILSNVGDNVTKNLQERLTKSLPFLKTGIDRINEINERANIFVDVLKKVTLGITNVATQSTKTADTIEKSSKKAAKASKDAAKESASAWKSSAEEIKESFDGLGVISKKQFDEQAEGLISQFEKITRQEQLTDQELLELREQLFVKLGELADNADESVTLGFDPEEVKSELDTLHQQLLDKVIKFEIDRMDVGNKTILESKKIQQTQFQIANDTIESLRSVVDNAFTFQRDKFESLKDQLDIYQKAYIKTEEEITDVVVQQTEERLNVITRFVDGALQQFIRLPITPFGGATFGPPSESTTNNTFNQTVNNNNTGNGATEQSQETLRTFNKMNASLAF